MNLRQRYPLRSHIDTAEHIVRETADRYNLALAEVRGPGTRGGPGGLVYVARIESARRCLAECIRPIHLSLALGISERRANGYYQILRRQGFGPSCIRRAS